MKAENRFGVNRQETKNLNNLIQQEIDLKMFGWENNFQGQVMPRTAHVTTFPGPA